jgi:hypothetical protein
MATQYQFGIEGLTPEEVLQQLPGRLPGSAVRQFSNGVLLRLRNILLACQTAYQTGRQARTLSDQLSRIEAEMDRRGLTAWLEGCNVCREHWQITELADGTLIGECRCTRALNIKLHQG